MQIEITERELTLIRVACMRRLDFLSRTMERYQQDAKRLAHLQASYDETKVLLEGKLWDAR